MYQLKQIGSIRGEKEKTVITVDREYRKALKYVDRFSHIHVFFGIKGENRWVCEEKVISIADVTKEGRIESADIWELSEAVLFDIKPYFPSEDSLRPEEEVSTGNIQESIPLEQDGEKFQIEELGIIRNKSGKVFVECKNPVELSEGYVKLLWWFHRFDKPQMRRVTECDPPYENAPRSGIFATRSPVRPNPIAMTVVPVTGVSEDGKKLYLGDIECFDQTPCIAILPYDREKDCIEEVKVPEWLAHWPKWIAGSKKPEKGELSLSDGELVTLLAEHVTEEKSNMTAVSDMKQMSELQEKPDCIFLKGGYENNLKHMNVKIPYGKITAVVGVSGSGKSSLVQDTIYAECKRRMEYLNNDSHVLGKPLMESMTGCIPTVLISQKPIGANVHSTVGTYSNAYDELRVIYAQAGLRHCPDCGGEILPLTKTVIKELLAEQDEVRIYDWNKEAIESGNLEERIENALESGQGAMYASIGQGEPFLLQTKQKCCRCDKLLFELTPSTFSYLDPESQCPDCNGTGKISVVEESKVIEKPELSILDGASSFWGKLRSFQKKPNANWMKGQVLGLAEKMQVDLEKPWKELPEEFRTKVLYGAEEENVTFSYQNQNGRNGEITRNVEGVCNIIRKFHEENPDSNQTAKYFTEATCTSCQGERLNREGRSVTIGQVRYPQAAAMSFEEMKDFCHNLPKWFGSERYEEVKAHVTHLTELCDAAIHLGIGYLELSRGTGMISGGEAQRLKLLSIFQNHMTGILYVFDEPSKGLHPKDYEKIIYVLKQLKAEGNTVLMVEHNEDMICAADYLIEIGPKAGENGGYLIGEGELTSMVNHAGTETSRYLGEEMRTRRISSKTLSNGTFRTFENLRYNNLKGDSIHIPMQALTCICGVSGSGKSSLMKGEIFPRAQLEKMFTEVVMVDQSAIGRSSRSVLATYIGIMDIIRERMAALPEASKKGFGASHFSFNSKDGQCDTCAGDGRLKLPYSEDAFVVCPKCHGRRYQKQILNVSYREQTIADLLAMSVEQALEFWKEDEEITAKLSVLSEVGMGYLKLGQSTATLSGGEASRLKLAKELTGRRKSNVLYLFDEPTTGLHFSDIEELLRLIEKLLNDGNTVVAIEHNRQFLENADWILEVGPGAGKLGGHCTEREVSKA